VRPSVAIIYGGTIEQVSCIVDDIYSLYERVVIANEFEKWSASRFVGAIERVYLAPTDRVLPHEICDAYQTATLFDLSKVNSR